MKSTGFERWRRALVVCGVVVGAAVVFAFDPATHRLYPPCLFRAISGLYCPGCGSLRAIHALLHGRVADAFAYNPLAVAMLPVMAAGLLAERLRRRERSPRAARLWARISRVLLVVIVGYGVLRNVPAYPFTLLAPGGSGVRSQESGVRGD